MKKPIDAKTLDDICELERDNIDLGNSWVLVSEKEVTIANQNPGENATSVTTLSREQFDKVINWYTTGEVV